MPIVYRKIEYPATLPKVTGASIQTVELRLVGDGAPFSARAYQSDYLGIQRITFPPMNAVQFAALCDWGKVMLSDWSNWFGSDWALPSGPGVGIRKWLKPPTRMVGPGGYWNIQGDCEVRGSSEVPIIRPKTKLLMHFDGNLVDEADDSRVFYNYAATAPDFGAPKFGIGGFKSAGDHAVFTGHDSNLILTSNYQIDCWVRQRTGSRSLNTVFDFGSWNGDAGNIPPGVTQLRISGQGFSPIGVGVQYRDNTGSFVNVANYGSGLAFTLNTWQHLGVAADEGGIRVYLDGALAQQSVLPPANIGPDSRQRLLIGGYYGGSGETFAVVAGGNCDTDELRWQDYATYQGSSIPVPTKPFRVVRS